MKHRKENAAVPGTGEDRSTAGKDAADTQAPEREPAAEAAGAGEEAARDETRAPAAGSSSAAQEESVDALRDRWLRTEADLQNFRRRARRDLEEATRFAEERMLLELIELLDDLERAVASAAEAGAADSWISGVKLVAGRMQDVLARHGVAAIDPAGAAFDPEHHEAMLEIAAADVPSGHVAQVVRKGYKRNGRVLRAARVVVARPPAEKHD